MQTQRVTLLFLLLISLTHAQISFAENWFLLGLLFWFDSSTNVRAGRSLLGGLSNALSGLMNGSIHTQQQRTFIQMGTKLKVVDNSGAKEVMCIQSLKGKKGARLGDVIVGSVKDGIPKEKEKKGKDVMPKGEVKKGKDATKGKVKKGMVVYGVVVRAAMPKRRADGSEVKFDDNAVVIVGIKDKKKKVLEFNQPIGTRVFGPVPHEMRLRKQLKILTLAQHLV